MPMQNVTIRFNATLVLSLSFLSLVLMVTSCVTLTLSIGKDQCVCHSCEAYKGSLLLMATSRIKGH